MNVLKPGSRRGECPWCWLPCLVFGPRAQVAALGTANHGECVVVSGPHEPHVHIHPLSGSAEGVRVVAVVLIYFPKISLLEEKAEERLGSRSEVIGTTSLGLKEGISIPGVSPAPD